MILKMCLKFTVYACTPPVALWSVTYATYIRTAVVISGLWMSINKISMDTEIELDSADRIVIIFLAMLVIVISILIASCFVIPGCCGHKWLHKGKRKGSLAFESLAMQIPKKKVSIIISDKDSPLNQSVNNQLKVIETQENGHSSPGVFNSNYTPLVFLPYPPPIPKKPPTVKLNITFCEGEPVNTLGRLAIEIIEVENLPERDYPTLPDSAVVLEVLNRHWSLIGPDKVIHRIQTRVIRSEVSPLFQQTFTFAATKSELKSWIIRLTATDQDKLTRCRETCSGKVNFKEVQCLSDGEACSIAVPLKPVIFNFGEILLSLCYLPTAQRLTVSVIKGEKLKWNNVAPSVHQFYPYARIVLVDHAGRIIKKRKISGTSGTESPTFSGSLTFQVSHTVFETATLLIVICSGMERDKISPEDDGNVSHRRKDILGYTALGWMVKGDNGREHWRTILSKPRSLVSKWHTLR